MTYVGARQNTAKQLATILGYDKLKIEDTVLFSASLNQANNQFIQGLSRLQTNSTEFVTANKLWVHSELKLLEGFSQTVKDCFLASLGIVNFVETPEDARGIINTWVKELTKGKIEDLIQPGILDQETKLVLTNAVYFKGSWLHAFKKEDTMDMPFNVGKENKVTAKMMRMKTKKDVRYYENEELQVLGLPYNDNRLVMTVVLPRKVDGIESVIGSMRDDPSQLKKWIDASYIQREISILFPKIKMSFYAEFNEILSSLGVNEMFDDVLADFSGITKERLLKVKCILQKAFLEVDEEGTEAAAATAVVMKTRCMPLRPIEFNANHPFVFFIADTETKAILFWGKVQDPTVIS